MTVHRTVRAAGAIGATLALLLAGVAPEAALAATQKSKASASKSKSAASKKASSSKKGASAKTKGKRGASKASSSKSKSSSRSSSRRESSRRETGSRRAVEEKVTGTAIGKLVEAEGPPRSYVVKKGQGLDAVVNAADVSKKQIVDLNKLKEPYHLKVGQKLKLPPVKGKAYVPESGDSLAAIAKRFGVSAKELASYNNLKAGSTPRPGKRILLPAGYRDTGPIRAPKPDMVAERPINERPRDYARPSETPPPAQAYNRPPPSSTPTLPPVQPRVNTPPPAIDPANVAASGAGRFTWPLQGRVIQPFGTRAGQADDGITIATPTGTPVRAAASGTVIYSGRQIAEFGNYVLIQHEGGFLTAYGNMDRVNVRMNQRVSQGEQIGSSGQTGTASQPQLHFEILYSARREDKSTPIDPMTLLPRQ